jgi:parallel beta-helix repeat protein
VFFNLIHSNKKGKMMMTKKRKIKSTSYSEPKPRFVRWVVATLGIVVAVGLGAVSTAQAATINVPSNYTTIQEAVDAAASGDTIMVAPGEYTGAAISTTVKIIGSGPSTRITTGVPPQGDGFLIWHPGAGTEICNLAVEVPLVTPYLCGVLMANADNCIVRDLKITADAFGIASLSSDNTVVTDNEISGGGIYGLYFSNSYDGTITGNTISGAWSRAICTPFSPGAVVKNNTVSGECRFGIEAFLSPGTDITANTVSVTGWYGIRVDLLSNDTTVKQNTIENFHCTADSGGAPIAVQRSSNCIVTNNTLIDVYYPDNYAQGTGPVAGIRVSGYGTWDYPCTNNIILGNDYKKSGLPGWNKKHPTGPGCVVLEDLWYSSGSRYGAAIDNFVSEKHHAYPAGTTICEQILDMTATPENPDGENTEVGMERCPEVSDYIDRLRDAAEREREEQELQEEHQQLLEELSLEEQYPLP